MFGDCVWLVVENEVWRRRGAILQTITGLRHELHQSLAINGGRAKKRSKIIPKYEIEETRNGDLYSLEFKTEGGHVSLAYRWRSGFNEEEKKLAYELFVRLEVPPSEGHVKNMRCNGPPWEWYELQTRKSI